MWHPRNSQQVADTACEGWLEGAGQGAFHRALEGRGDQHQERKRELVETSVVITTLGVIVIQLRDLPPNRGQTEKEKVSEET